MACTYKTFIKESAHKNILAHLFYYNSYNKFYYMKTKLSILPKIRETIDNAYFLVKPATVTIQKNNSPSAHIGKKSKLLKM